MTVAVVIPAAGRGERLGADRPKAFVDVAGRSLLEHAVDGIRPVADLIVVAAPTTLVEQVRSLLSDVEVVAGGDVRQDSVRAALALLPADVDIVLVHDAARAWVPVEVSWRVVQAVRDGADAVIPVVAVTDTVKEVESDGAVVRTVDRTSLRCVQTPQGFRRDVLVRAHAAGATGPSATDDAGLVEALGLTVVTVEGSAEAFKVTTPFDLEVARALMTSRSAGV